MDVNRDQSTKLAMPTISENAYASQNARDLGENSKSVFSSSAVQVRGKFFFEEAH